MARKVDKSGPGSVIDGEVYRPGKFLYMAPEVFRGETYCPKAADVYSLGVMLFMLLTGVPPYTTPESCDQRFHMLSDGSQLGVEALLRACKKVEVGTPVASREVIDMLSYMLCPASKRYSLKEILSHPFLREKDPKSPKLKIDVNDILSLSPREEGKTPSVQGTAGLLPLNQG